MSEHIPDAFFNVLAEWLFSAIVSRVEDKDTLDLLVLYSWAATGHGDPALVLTAIQKLNEINYF